jgi:hypothetical protein
MTEANHVIHSSVVDKDGDQYTQATLTSTDDEREKVVLAKPCVIPVLFIPGIMGTNLRQKGSKRKAWRPPNADLAGAADLIGQLFSYAFKTTEKRAAELNMPSVEIDPRGPIDPGDSGLPENVLVARGWGALMRSSYHPFMGQLQDKLNNLAKYDFACEMAKLQDWAAGDGQTPPNDWGASSGDALTKDEILHAANYQFDLWAGGYNWLQSNRDSGAAIKDYIEKVILPYYNEGKAVKVKDTPDGEGNNECRIQRKKPSRPLAEQVIVVTHSMGGMVSRSLTEIHNCDKVMGVSHGVQPSTGAPATYKRMRSGFEGAEQLLLGRNAADVVAILSQAPGGLELLPTADYNDGKPWLKVRDKNGTEILALPKNGDPYKEIYNSPAWYGMVPEGNLGLMTPGEKSQSKEGGGKQSPDSLREILSRTIEKVQKFHEAIAKKYKTPTYAHYGAQGQRDKAKDRGSLLASKNLFTWGEVAWEGQGLASLDPEKIVLGDDDGNGELKTTAGIKLTISEPDCPGDGTVPVYSGEAPGKAGIALSFAHGHGNPGTCNEHFSYDHQGSYGDKHKRSLYASMYAIIKIAQQAQWHKK